MRRRRQKTPLDMAAKEVKRRKLQFERDASHILSEALGFEVTVKIKRQKLAPPKAGNRQGRPTPEQKRRLAELAQSPLAWTTFPLVKGGDAA